MIPRGHHAPAYIPVGRTLLRVPFQGVGLLHGLPWSTNCIEPKFYAVPFKFEFNQLLIFIEKFSPLLRFEPGTSAVPSWYATNWAILAWILNEIIKTWKIKLATLELFFLKLKLEVRTLRGILPLNIKIWIRNSSVNKTRQVNNLFQDLWNRFPSF